MITFQVPSMTCGRCASAISRAIASVDKDARVDIQIQQKLVQISSAATAAELAEAIQEAGYAPREVRETIAAAEPANRGGCGCGTRKTAPVDAGQQAAAPRRPCCA